MTWLVTALRDVGIMLKGGWGGASGCCWGGRGELRRWEMDGEWGGVEWVMGS